MSIWYDQVYRPYVAQFDGEAALLLDDFVCHKSHELKDAMETDNTMRFMIPPGYTCVLQPCDVGINKPLKDRLKHIASSWRRERWRTLPDGARMPTPSRSTVLQLLKKIWDEFPAEIVQNSFRRSGYVFEEGVDQSGATDSESDSDE